MAIPLKAQFSNFVGYLLCMLVVLNLWSYVLNTHRNCIVRLVSCLWASTTGIFGNRLLSLS